MASIIYLVRHGEHVRNVLTPRGREEVKVTANKILDEFFGDTTSGYLGGERFFSVLEGLSIYHSPQKRARESAEILAEELRSKCSLSSLSAALRLEEKVELDLEKYTVKAFVEEISSPLSIVVSHQPDLFDCAEKFGIKFYFEKTGSYCKIENPRVI